jgi:hypothetical protein
VQVFEAGFSERGWLLSAHVRKDLILKIRRWLCQWRRSLKRLAYLLKLLELVSAAGTESEMALNLSFLL